MIRLVASPWRVRPFRAFVVASTRTLVTSKTRVSKNRVAWQAEDNEDIQRVTQKAIIHELMQRQSQTIESVVPWFLENMPVRNV